MFAHIFTARLKCLLRDRGLVFWTLFFPIILSVFFKMGFSNLNTSDNFRPIPAAVVDDAQYRKDASFRQALQGVSEGNGRLFILTVTTREKAGELLKKNKIYGYFTAGNPVGVTVRGSGYEQSILKSFADSYLQTYSAASYLIGKNPAAAAGIAKSLQSQQDFTKALPPGGGASDSTTLYFYSLVAMACLYGSFWGLKEVMDIQADLSQRAARINTAPVHKMKVFLSGVAASFAVDFSEVLLLLVFLRFALNVGFGGKTGFIVLTALLGTVNGIFFGAFVGAAVKSGEGMKVGILIGLSMLGSALSGMMYEGIKYIIQQNVPLLGYLNPVNLLADAFYCLYCFDSYGRYTLDMCMLGGFVLFFGVGTYLIIRRQKYASL